MNTRTLLADADLGFIKGPGGYAPQDGGAAGNSGATFAKFMSNMIGFLTILAGLAFLLYFMLGAINWVTAGGDKSKTEAAKNQLTAAGIGLVIVVASYAITAIVGQVLGIDILLQNNPINNLGPTGT